MENHNPLTEKIIACCFDVHSELGPGFNEKIYHNAVKLALEKSGLQQETEKIFTVFFQNKKVGSLKLDLVVEKKIIVEIKAIIGDMPDIFKYQIISYLKIAKLNVGLLINFGNKSCQIKRFMY